MRRPLVSLCVLFYNHRRWLGAALDAAFAQTYRPLEVVISDDASTDGSSELIRDYIAACAPGDVMVVYNRNPENLGILGNWMKAASLSHGELLVMAGGDDVSLPERVERIAEAWLADGRRAAVVSHAGYRIDPEGRSLGVLPAPCANAPLGAAMAWRRDLYTAFSPVPIRPRCVEDVPFAKRSLMLGSELVLPDRLVKYRIGTGHASPLCRHRESAIYGWRSISPSLDQALHDLSELSGRMSPERSEGFRRKFALERARAENHLVLLESPSFRERWKAFLEERRTGFCVAAPFMYAYLLPRRLGDLVLDGITRLNLARRRLNAAALGSYLQAGRKSAILPPK